MNEDNISGNFWHKLKFPNPERWKQLMIDICVSYQIGSILYASNFMKYKCNTVSIPKNITYRFVTNEIQTPAFSKWIHAKISQTCNITPPGKIFQLCLVNKPNR